MALDIEATLKRTEKADKVMRMKRCYNYGKVEILEEDRIFAIVLLYINAKKQLQLCRVLFKFVYVSRSCIIKSRNFDVSRRSILIL